MKLRGLLFSPSSKSSFTLKIQHAFHCTLFSESELDQVTLKDLVGATESIEKGSRSFHFSSLLFPWEVRQDIHTVYFFCRVTDDIADEETHSIEQRKIKLNKILTLIQSAYDCQKCKKSFNFDEQVLLTPETFSALQISAVRGMCRLIAIIPFHSIEDLFKGYFWDLNETVVHDTKDVIQYSKYVASTVGEMMTHLMLFPSKVPDLVLRQASDFSIAMQLTNIARDIITDSKLHRVYLPLELVPPHQSKEFASLHMRLLKNDAQVSDLRLIRTASLQLISLAKEYQVNGEKGLKALPKAFRTPVKLASRIYSEIGNVIQTSPSYPERAV
ncbi:hypothetical protein HMI56_004577, partial [Coelomomyces lativittatus]